MGLPVMLVMIALLPPGRPVAAQGVERGGPAGTPEPATALPDAHNPAATPTIDRLAAPPTVAVPNQADEGAQLFWLHCQPCHGDQGQGLTDDWRAQYPPEDQNCWDSGCHGERPYDPAFQLPTAVPAIIGDGTLQKFQTLDGVYRYVSVAMPYFFPGDLTQEEYLAIVAHMARANGVWDGAPLTVDTLINYPLHAAAGVQSTPQPTPTPISTPKSVPSLSRLGIGIGVSEVLVIAACAAVLVVVTGVLVWTARRH